MESNTRRSRSMLIAVAVQELAEGMQAPSASEMLVARDVPDPVTIHPDPDSRSQTKRQYTPEEESRHQDVQVHVDLRRKLGAPRERRRKPKPSSAPHYRRNQK